MNFSYTRRYTGQVALVAFDWAGTTVDHGCCAPAMAFILGFAQHGVTITKAQARGPMGMEKRDHIAAVASMPQVIEAWQNVHGRPVNEQDIDAMYEAFVPLLFEVLADCSTIIDGVVETVDILRKQNIKIGASTGYFQEAADLVAQAAARAGYTPDYTISASEVSAGRPSPWMLYRIMEELQVYPPEAVVNVGDTVVDIHTALNGGVWSVGVAATGNLCGLSHEELRQLPANETASLINAARRELYEAGAHYVIDSVADLPEVIEAINQRLQRGERP